MKKHTQAIWFLSAAITFQIVGCGSNNHQRETEVELFEISTAVGQYVGVSHQQIPELATGISHDLYHRLCNIPQGGSSVRILRPNPRWDSEGKLVDFWGEIYGVQITITNKSGKAHYVLRVWSKGPNRSFDGFEGDDIARETILQVVNVP